MATEDPKKVKPGNSLSNLPADIEAAWERILHHDSSAVFAVIVLSFLLSAYIWYAYGVAAAAPVLASNFICLAFFV